MITLFNLIHQILNLNEMNVIGKEIMETIEKIIRKCKEEGMEIGIGASFSPKIRMGEIDDTSFRLSNYSLDSNSLPKAMKFARISESNSLFVEPLVHSFIPETYNNICSEVQSNDSDEVYFKYVFH